MVKKASQSGFFLTDSPNPKEWDNFLRENDGSFLQSFAWGEFQTSLQRKVSYLLIRDRRGKIRAQLLTIQLPLPLGQTLLYSPLPSIFHPKLTISEQKEVIALLLNQLREESSILFRLDPKEESTPFLAQLYRSLGFIPSLKHLQPRGTLVLDITPSEQKLLASFKPKTRYNIRLADKKGVAVRESDSPEDLPLLLSLLKATSSREGIRLHPKEYYQQQFAALAQRGQEKLFLAYYHGRVVGGILVSFFGERATYLHGGSLKEFRQIMAPHLLQWTAIKRAKTLGCRWYDFWGITESADPNHPWAGLTRFKLGFGGKKVSYLPAQELPLRKFWYSLYHLLRG